MSAKKWTVEMLQVEDDEGCYVGYLQDFSPADVRLATAAPELLALLRKVHDEDMARDHDEEVHDAIGLLIRRIDGEST